MSLEGLDPDLCVHARPLYIPIGSVMRGDDPCDECADEDWDRVKQIAVAGLIVLMTLIWVPLIMLLCGMFWA